ncbi:MAG: VWA domain-containing protein [Planctomycetes bacterium]|nr:VWA domain-containing protein [Planctomycetota bacterium]
MKYLNFANSVSGNGLLEFLMTLIDLSPSMDYEDWKPSRKAGALRANIELIKLKAQHHPQDMAGVIGFGSYAELLHDPVNLANGARSICDSLKHIPNPSGTNFTAALEMAEDCFRDAHSSRKNSSANKGLLRTLTDLIYEPDTCHSVNNEITKRIIMLTDGEHNGSSNPEKVADRLKNAGVIIDCIGIGGTPKDVDEKLLKKIASRNQDGSIRYCFIGDQQTLLRKYETLARHIRPV